MCCHKCDVSLIFPHYFFNICGNCRDVISIPDNFCFLFILSKSDQKILIFFFNLLKETFLGCISFSVVFHFSISLISIKICNFFLLIHLKWGYFIISLMSIRIALSLSLSPFFKLFNLEVDVIDLWPSILIQESRDTNFSLNIASALAPHSF